MNCNKRNLYMISLLLFIALFLVVFIPQNLIRIIAGVVLIIFSIIVFAFIKKRSILSINKGQVSFLMFIMGLVYVMIYYLTGLSYGFFRNLDAFSIEGLFKYIIPISAIIISIELIRSIILAQKNRLASFLVLLSSLLVDLILFANVYNITNFNGFMDNIGLAIFPAITFNVLYTFLSKNYGKNPNILFRLIITLYPYVLPIIPKTPDFLVAFAKLVIPLLIYLFINVLYDKQKKVVSHRAKRASVIGVTVGLVLMISLVMLVSCQFRFGILVIGSESMTGEINKGDAVVYEEYRGQIVEEGDVIVFKADKSRIVHRVVDIEHINGETRYYTKGDANEDMDYGYITDSDIIGVTQFKILYIGYPTLWLRSIFEN